MSSAEIPLEKPWRVHRYALIVRVAHWTNLLCLTILLMSGLQIFNAHPALYWGDDSDFDRPFAALGAFPGWLTIPSFQDLATGRVWHFFFGWQFVINGLVYATYSLVSGRLARDLATARGDWRRIGTIIREHAMLRFPRARQQRATTSFSGSHIWAWFLCWRHSSFSQVSLCRRLSTPRCPGSWTCLAAGSPRAPFNSSLGCCSFRSYWFM